MREEKDSCVRRGSGLLNLDFQKFLCYHFYYISKRVEEESTCSGILQRIPGC